MKRKGDTIDEPSNLKRFKSVIRTFNREHTSEWAAIQGGGGVRELQKKTQTVSRKERRKQDRKLKKMRNQAFKEHKPIPTRESIEKEKKTAEKAEKMSRLKEKKRLKKKEKKKKTKVNEKEESDSRRQGLLEANKVEDRTIKQLEKQLKLKNRKSKSLPAAFIDDGLDYLLEAVDSESLSKLYKGGNVSDEEELPKASWEIGDDEDISEESQDESAEDVSPGEESDISETQPEIGIPHLPEASSVTGILKKSKKDMKRAKKDINEKSVQFEGDDSNADDSFSDIADDSDDSVSSNVDSMDALTSKQMSKDKVTKKQESKLKKAKQKGKSVKNTEDSNIDDERKSGSEEESLELSDEAEQSQLREDIYGRLRDTSGNVTTGAYVPPGKRRQLATTTDAKRRLELERLGKQLKGLLNRLSEGNVQGISSQIEELYRSHSRMDVTETLTSLVLDACVSVTLIPERLIMEHIMLIAILHGNIGTEIGAYFLQTLVKKFDAIYSGDEPRKTKELDNLVVVLANLYNFKILHSVLVFDVMRLLVDSFTEEDIELLLLLLRNVGFSLRKDDPVTLKEVVVNIQAKAAAMDITQVSDQSRVRFMLEVLLAIKNNNMRKIPNYDPTHLDHLRKLLRNYVKGTSLGEGELRISLRDLLAAEDRGRWWLVGSAWSGPQDAGSAQAGPSNPLSTTPSDVSAHILDLARQQRMNTDVRKNIFCIIMTCEDFVDAFEKLLRLGLKHQQEREIIHVIVDLCAQEKSFNQFYAFLAQKFSEFDRRFQMTIQFTLWDKFKALGELGEKKAANLAAFVTHLLATKALSLSVFKVIEFGELDKPRVRFLKLVLASLLVDQPEHVIRDIFTRISALPKLQVLREGLKLFMKHFLLRSKKNTEPEGRRLLEERIEIAERAVTSADAKMLL